MREKWKPTKYSTYVDFKLSTEQENILNNGCGSKKILSWIVLKRVTVEVELTTNHMGYMILKLCPINDKNKVTTEECFDQYPLYLADNNSTASYVIPGNPCHAITIQDLNQDPLHLTVDVCWGRHNI